MSETCRLGVFELGQFWYVVGVDQEKLGFPTRERAVAAAKALAAIQLGRGAACEVLVQEPGGRLTRLDLPRLVAEEPRAAA